MRCRETTDHSDRASPSQLIRSLAPIRNPQNGFRFEFSGHDCVQSISALRPSSLQRYAAEMKVVHAGVLTSHVHRHPWEEAGYVPVLR